MSTASQILEHGFERSWPAQTEERIIEALQAVERAINANTAAVLQAVGSPVKTANAGEDVLDIKEFCLLVGTNRKTVMRHAKEGLVCPIRMGTAHYGRIKFKRSDIPKYLEALRARNGRRVPQGAKYRT